MPAPTTQTSASRSPASGGCAMSGAVAIHTDSVRPLSVRIAGSFLPTAERHVVAGINYTSDRANLTVNSETLQMSWARPCDRLARMTLGVRFFAVLFLLLPAAVL